MNVCVTQQLANMEVPARTQMVGMNAPALQHGPGTAVITGIFYVNIKEGPAVFLFEWLKRESKLTVLLSKLQFHSMRTMPTYGVGLLSFKATNSKC